METWVGGVKGYEGGVGGRGGGLLMVMMLMIMLMVVICEDGRDASNDYRLVRWRPQTY